nr:reverse transcriptase zinc-binding domain-containing protein [Tanacetum cinerariifolium]
MPVRIITGHVGVVQVKEKVVRIIPGLAGIIQLAKLHKQSDIHEVLYSKYYWRSHSDSKRSLKYTTWYNTSKVIDEGGYGKDITVGSALILANVSVFSPKPPMHYLSITMRNVI